MYEIEETEYGYRMTFEGFLTRDILEDWVGDLRKVLTRSKPTFGVLVDMRGASALPSDAQEVNFQGIQLCRDHGMDRTAVVVANPITKIQANRVAKETGIGDIVAFVDASSDQDWESTALKWIRQAVPVAV